MPFQDMMRDKITVKTQHDGVSHADLLGSVQGDKVFLMQSSPKIEAGDEIVRHASNGSEMRMIVVDPGFHEAFHGIPAHYQMTVRKWNAPQAVGGNAAGVSYVFNGDNARVNYHSTDNSTNIIDNSSDSGQLLAELRQLVLAQGYSNSDRQESLEVVDALDEQFNSGKPKRKIVTALIESLPPAIAATDLCIKLIELASQIRG